MMLRWLLCSNKLTAKDEPYPRNPYSLVSKAKQAQTPKKMIRAKSIRLSPRLMFEKLAPGIVDNPPAILQLPPELLLEIYAYLQTDAQALLTLTCKTLLYRLGNKSWESSELSARWHGSAYTSRWGDAPRQIPDWMLTPDTLVRVPFLQALARDSPGLTFCKPCRVLHPTLPGPGDLVLKKQDSSPCLAAEGVVDWFERDGDRGYTLVWEHVSGTLDAHEAGLKSSRSPGDFSGIAAQYTLRQMHELTTIIQTVTHSAISIKRNLMLRHTHVFSRENKRLAAGAIFAFPLRVCPHLTTSQAQQSKSIAAAMAGNWLMQKIGSRNSPLLTLAINSAFPPDLRCDQKTLKKKFRGAYAREESQLDADREPEDFWWCRSCPTKFQIIYDKVEGALRVDVLHNLGSSSAVAAKNFDYLVRGGGNNEFSALSRTFPDFECQETIDPVGPEQKGRGSEASLLLAARRMFVSSGLAPQNFKAAEMSE